MKVWWFFGSVGNQVESCPFGLTHKSNFNAEQVDGQSASFQDATLSPKCHQVSNRWHGTRETDPPWICGFWQFRAIPSFQNILQGLRRFTTSSPCNSFKYHRVDQARWEFPTKLSKLWIARASQNNQKENKSFHDDEGRTTGNFRNSVPSWAYFYVVLILICGDGHSLSWLLIQSNFFVEFS